MPYGEDITINVGDAVRIHPDYVNYKFKKLLYGETYFVKELHTDYDKKVKVLETESGFLIRLNMDKRYFEHAGKEVVLEPTYERNYELFIGDVVLVTTCGYGLIDEDEGKYVEVIGKGNYFDDPGVEVKPYQCALETSKGCGSIGDQGFIGYESFGNNPMVLLNTGDEIVSTTTALGQVLEEYTGSSSNYYKVFVKNPTTLPSPYEAECNDLIEALQMTFAEGNAFKGIWRKAKARQGVKKKGYDNGVYDSEKVVFFGERMLIEARENESV